MTLRNIAKKPWFNEAMSLDELINKLISLRDQLAGRPCKVIGVSNPRSPEEAEVISIKMRSEMLDDQIGKHLNALGGAVTDVEIDDSASDAAAEIERDGDVVYVVLGLKTSEAAPEIYEA